MVRPNWLRPVRGSLRLVLLCLSLLLSLTLCLSVSVHSECSRTATPRHATQSTASASASGLDTLTTSRLAPCSTELQNCSTAPYRTGHHRTAPAERAAAMAGVCCPNPSVIGGPSVKYMEHSGDDEHERLRLRITLLHVGGGALRCTMKTVRIHWG